VRELIRRLVCVLHTTVARRTQKRGTLMKDESRDGFAAVERL